MAGRASEESNESYNSELETIKERLRTMKTTVGKVRVLNARSQSNLKSSVLAPKKKIMESTTGKERGHYKVKSKTETREGKIVPFMTHEEVEWAGKSYIRLSNNMLVPTDWEDICEWIVGRKVPKSWRQAMAKAKTEGLTELDKAKEWFANC